MYYQSTGETIAEDEVHRRVQLVADLDSYTHSALPRQVEVAIDLF